jgi:hypothetical protein
MKGSCRPIQQDEGCVFQDHPGNRYPLLLSPEFSKKLNRKFEFSEHRFISGTFFLYLSGWMNIVRKLLVFSRNPKVVF